MNDYAYDDEPMIPAPRRPGKARGRERPWWVGQDATKTRHEVVCPGYLHRVGILEHGEHLVYRHHTYVTATGHRFECPNGLKLVCEVPVENRGDVQCRHQLGEP